MIKAGELDEVIELFAPTAPVDDGYTTLPAGYASQGDWPAKYMPGTVREVFESASRESQLPAVFLVRRDPASETIDATWKLLFDGDAYDIEGATKRDRDGILIKAIASDMTFGSLASST